MLMQNEFDNQEEVILIEYDKVIKNSDQYLLHRMGNDLANVYDPFFDLSMIRDMDMSTCMTVAHMTKVSNIFPALAKVKLGENWYEDFMKLYFLADDMFEKCDLLDIGQSLFLLANQKFTKQIYIWSRYKDDRIVYDLHERHASRSKMKYVYGDLKEVLDMISEKVTMFILSDVDHCEKLVDYEHLDYTELMIASYRFNKYKNEDGTYDLALDPKLFGRNHVKVNEFTPVKLLPDNFTQILK